MTHRDAPKSRSPLIGALKGILVGGGIGVMIAALIDQIDASMLRKMHLLIALAEARDTLTAWDLLALPVLSLLVLGMHEVGHLAAGLSQGMRFLLLIVGPFRWHGSANGIRFEWNTNVALMGGLAAAAPTKMDESLRRQLLVLTAGGPVASLLLAIVALGLTSLFGARGTAYCAYTAVLSLGIFVATLIPVHAGGFMSDGMLLLDLHRHGDAVRERTALLQVLAQSIEGVRPREWDVSALNHLATVGMNDPLQRAGAVLYLLSHAMDRHNNADVSRYAAQLEEYISDYPSGFRQAVSIELAISAWLMGDTDAVRRHVAASSGGVVEQSRRLLAHAALARLEARIDDCEHDRRLAISALATSSDAGQRKLTEDQLEMLQ